MSNRDRFKRLIDAVCDGLQERDEAVRLTLLATISAESVFLLGPPGVAKSLIARRAKHAFRNAKSFEYLMGRFSTPEELFGPISIRRLRDDDVYERVTENYLPDADIVFLDEVWKASPPIQNALLTALNEKLYRNGNREIKIPLKVVVGASNELPAVGEGLEAFWDRFLIRLRIEPLRSDAAFDAMIADVRELYADTVPEDLKITSEEYGAFGKRIDSVAISEDGLSILHDVRERIREYNSAHPDGEPILVSDRRWKQIVRVLRASALLNGRAEIDVMDCFIVAHCIWNSESQIAPCRQIVQEAVRKNGFSSSLNVAGIAVDLEAVKRDVDTGTLAHREREESSPVLYEGEYVRILGVPGVDKETHVRAWKGDLDALTGNGATALTASGGAGAKTDADAHAPNRSVGDAESDRKAPAPGTSSDAEPAEIDLFHFVDGTYSHTERCRISLDAVRGDVVYVNRVECRIETRRQLVSVAERRAPAAAAAAEWDHRVDEIISRCRATIEHILAVKDAESEEAIANLFVPRGLAEIAFEPLDRAADEIAAISVAAEKTRAAYRSVVTDSSGTGP